MFLESKNYNNTVISILVDYSRLFGPSHVYSSTNDYIDIPL